MEKEIIPAKHIKTILISGPECSGKTVVSVSLSDRIDAFLIPEYSVEYLNALGRKYVYIDLLKIAQNHNQLYMEAFNKISDEKYLLLDSFLPNILIWSEYRFGKSDPWLMQRLQTLKIDFVFLFKPVEPWLQAPFRENPNDRMVLYNRYRALYEELKWEFIEIDGSEADRLERCYNIIMKRHQD